MDRMNELLQGIDTVIIRVTDIERSKKWYEQQLGLGVTWYEDQMKLAVMDAKGATSLTLWQTNKPIQHDPATATYPIFKTPDAAALRDELQQRNVQTGELIKDDYVHYFFFYDPDGNVLEACQVHE